MTEGEADRAGLVWRPRAALFYLAAGFLAVAAVATRNPVPLFLALPLLLAPVSAAVQAPRSGASAKIDWRDNGSGADVIVGGTLEPSAGVAASQLALRFFPAEPLVPGAPPRWWVEGGQLRFHAPYHAPYPCLLPFSLPEVLWRDPLGLVEASIPVIGEALRIERFPPEVSRVGAVRLRRTTSSPGDIRSRTVGSSGEFFAVRAAGPTDTARQINWWATARSGKLLANDYQLERTGDLLLLVDLRPSSLGPDRDRQLLSISCAAALGIAQSFLAEKSRVGLALFDEFLTAIPLGTGRLQRHKIYRALSKAQLAETPGPAERCAVSLRRYFPSGVTTLLLSSLSDEDSMLLLPHLRRRGFPTFVLSPSPLPLLRSASGRETADDALAMRLLHLVRRQRLGAAWREAPVVEWEDYWSLAPLVNYLTTPARAWSVT